MTLLMSYRIVQSVRGKSQSPLDCQRSSSACYYLARCGNWEPPEVFKFTRLLNDNSILPKYSLLGRSSRRLLYVVVDTQRLRMSSWQSHIQYSIFIPISHQRIFYKILPGQVDAQAHGSEPEL
jgi:hypothetical protein